MSAVLAAITFGVLYTLGVWLFYGVRVALINRGKPCSLYTLLMPVFDRSAVVSPELSRNSTIVLAFIWPLALVADVLVGVIMLLSMGADNVCGRIEADVTMQVQHQKANA